MRNFNIKTIRHGEQRYPTAGDYWLDSEGTEQVRVSDAGNPDYEFLVAVHELIELWLCEKRGIPEPLIRAFDEEFERNRKEGNADEPGNDPRAPYHKEHLFATFIEQEIAGQIGIDWNEYDKALNSL